MGKKERNEHEGEVYWGVSRRIDHDSRGRRRYVVIVAKGDRVKVSKLTSLDEKKKLDPRFTAIKMYPGLKNETGVYQSVYGKDLETGLALTLVPGNGVFDPEPIFSLDNEDFFKVDSRVKKRGRRGKDKKKNDT